MDGEWKDGVRRNIGLFMVCSSVLLEPIRHSSHRAQCDTVDRQRHRWTHHARCSQHSAAQREGRSRHREKTSVQLAHKPGSFLVSASSPRARGWQWSAVAAAAAAAALTSSELSNSGHGGEEPHARWHRPSDGAALFFVHWTRSGGGLLKHHCRRSGSGSSSRCGARGGAHDERMQRRQARRMEK